jgi:serine O-acetyltransferase
LIGKGVIIASNAFVVKSVPECTKISIINPELQYKFADFTNGTNSPTKLEKEKFWDYVI